MIDEKLSTIVEECVRLRGRDAVEKNLADLIRTAEVPEEAILTIVGNSGVHPIPAQYLRGEVYSASHGNWDVSALQALEAEFKRLLGQLGHKLHERSWQRIYFIPTGHPALSIHIKLFVYRITRIDTIDLVYLKGRYYELSIDHRQVMLEKQESE
jgi:hypothetical protein